MHPLYYSSVRLYTVIGWLKFGTDSNYLILILPSCFYTHFYLVGMV